ncbi:MAG: aminomethyl-transferring glycine dehydrogenase subunit GcvPB [Haloferacaceae archaeon]
MTDERREGGYGFDQARWSDDDAYVPLLSETSGETAEPGDALPDDLTRDSLSLPTPAEPTLVRHYTRLSELNYGVDSGPYPLGSCTMKFNPSFTEDVAALPDAAVHPDRPDETVQGVLALQHRLQDALARVGGMDAVTLQPPAGAAGEFTGIEVAKAYHRANGEGEARSEVLIPASAHGTNFATAAMAGYEVVELPPAEDGRLDVDALAAAAGDETAALMLTNPNTVGLFERDVTAAADLVHDAGGLLYYDGANLNALLGRARPGDMGFDVMHYNVHKTFATPHGGGGPGAGPVGVVEDLAEFLPTPHVRETETGYETYEPPDSIGKVHGYAGNWLVLVKAYAYLARLGDEGLADASATAVLNANYLAEQIDLTVPYRPFHHEFAATAGDRDAADLAKAMLDHGVHPPTTKWPEFVDEAMLTEPTEAETKRDLDALAAAFDAAAGASDEELAAAPKRTAARRIDQVSAAREPRLSWHALADEDGAD